MRILSSLIFFSLFVAPSRSSASHIMGAELSYTWLGGNEYVFRLALYRDCQGVPAPPWAAVQFSSVSCGEQFSLQLGAVDTVALATGCAGLLTTCDGGSLPGARLYLYRDTITLPAACTDWEFTWTECCRNAAISNLVSPSGNLMYVSARLNNLLVSGNSSPVFQEFMGPFVCGGVPMCMPNSAYDPDGDSLVFAMKAAQGLNGVPLAYVPGMSPMEPYPSSNGHAFDAMTGNHCATPIGLGAFVLSYRVDEYRNGDLIASNDREMQIWVLNCPTGSISVSGTVLDTTGAPVTAGGVELYAYGLNSAGSIRLDSIGIGANGEFAFASWPLGQYLVRAIPDSVLYPHTATSYHRSTHYWTYADILYAVCDTLIEANISLVDTWDLNGTGYLEGYLGDLGIVRAQGPGVPWPGQGVALETWPGGELAAYAWTDENGVFRFGQIPFGTYRILVDHPGLPMLAFHVVSVSVGAPTITGLAYTAMPEGVDILLATSIGQADKNEAHVRLYPNPAGSGSITLAGVGEGEQVWEFRNAAGALVDRQRVMASGDLVRIPVSHLPAGVYLLGRQDAAPGHRVVVH